MYSKNFLFCAVQRMGGATIQNDAPPGPYTWWSTSIWQTAVSPVPLAGSSLDTPREHAAELVLDILHVTQPPSLSVEVSIPKCVAESRPTSGEE